MWAVLANNRGASLFKDHSYHEALQMFCFAHDTLFVAGEKLQNSKIVSTLTTAKDTMKMEVEEDDFFYESLDTYPDTFFLEKTSKSSIISIKYNLGKTCEMFNIDTAEKFYLDAMEDLDQVRKTEAFEEDVVVALYHNLARIYYKKKLFNLAYSTYSKALGLKISSTKFHDLICASTLHCMGVAKYQCLEKNDSDGQDESVQLLKRCLKLRESYLAETHEDTARTLEVLTMCYTLSENFDLAEECYSRTLKIRIKLFGENHVIVALTLTRMGMVYFNRRKFEKSMKVCSKAWKYFEANKTAGKHPEVFANMIRIAELYSILRDLESASKIMYSALENAQRFHATTEHYFTMAYGTLGNIRLRQKKFFQAFDFFEKQWKSLKNDPKSEKNALAQCLFKKAQATRGSKDFPEAIKLLEEAIATADDSDHARTMGCYFEIGYTYSVWKKFKKAMEAFEKCIQIGKEVESTRMISEILAASIYFKAQMQMRQRKFSDALQSLLESYSFRKKFMLCNNDNAFATLFHIANIYCNQGNEFLAISYLNQALDLARNIFGESSQQVQNALFLRGQLHYKRGENNLAYEDFQLAYTNMLSGGSFNGQLIGKILRHLSKIYFERGDTSLGLWALAEESRILGNLQMSYDDIYVLLSKSTVKCTCNENYCAAAA